MELINEILVLGNCYFMVMYSEFVPDAYVRYDLGWFNIVLIALMILINVVMIGSNNIHNIYRKAKIANSKRIYRKSLIDRELKRSLTSTLMKALEKDKKIVYEESSESSASVN